MSSRAAWRLLTTISAAAALTLGVAGCGNGGDGGTAPQGGDKIKTVASTNVWGSVLTAVGGDQVEVKSIIGESGDPHSYETTSEDGLAAQNAKLTLGNGGGYDDFFTKLTDQAPGARKLVAYDIAATGDENEHVWYSLAAVQKVADQVAAQLGELKPDAKQAFTDNANAFKAKVGEVQKKAEQIGAAHPDTKVVATEPIADYLLRTAKVDDATPDEFSEAIEEETDVPAGALDQVKQLVAGKQVKAVVNNVQTTTPVTEQIVSSAKNVGLPVVDVSETLPAGVTDYIAWMSKEVDALAGALGG
ncbi:metal ABC transporter solute-binding protein, Zn/Mn family [Amycolatopsis anabasis]|uniref:metal ABC transporter solute-binding protein, Zn/Mn family n=1 Tax=Amycolatopsis anabasis TaxID=1840409 RepID=UPI00131EA9FD|nr:zinc ABC transporter substrate-binding protein [Amycolatopsis anabasis]